MGLTFLRVFNAWIVYADPVKPFVNVTVAVIIETFEM
jgi:hypothetical protein